MAAPVQVSVVAQGPVDGDDGCVGYGGAPGGDAAAAALACVR